MKNVGQARADMAMIAARIRVVLDSLPPDERKPFRAALSLGIDVAKEAVLTELLELELNDILRKAPLQRIMTSISNGVDRQRGEVLEQS
jgi:hypothetical protein